MDECGSDIPKRQGSYREVPFDDDEGDLACQPNFEQQPARIW